MRCPRPRCPSTRIGPRLDHHDCPTHEGPSQDAHDCTSATFRGGLSIIRLPSEPTAFTTPLIPSPLEPAPSHPLTPSHGVTGGLMDALRRFLRIHCWAVLRGHPVIEETRNLPPGNLNHLGRTLGHDALLVPHRARPLIRSLSESQVSTVRYVSRGEPPSPSAVVATRLPIRPTTPIAKMSRSASPGSRSIAPPPTRTSPSDETSPQHEC